MAPELQFHHFYKSVMLHNPLWPCGIISHLTIMPDEHFPLRWESTGDQWWYACPIDYAAANGHYESVRELLRLDRNNIIQFTSLRRTRRLETVWDDNEKFHDVAKLRSRVAQKLYMECETSPGKKSSLIRAGYGGWLLYTAASAGDLSFVQELLQKDPLLVFGEGEYGVTDIFYAAARSKSFQVFRFLYDFGISPRFSAAGDGEFRESVGEVPSAFTMEMMNRAVHAAARGGNIQVLKYLLQNVGSDVLAYRDAQGSTILHAAASKGQVQVVSDLLSCLNNIVRATDNRGNTALHVAAYKGQLAVVKSLIATSPSNIYLKNNVGDNFLHAAVSGFKTHAFRQMDRQLEFMKQLVSGEVFDIKGMINAKNNDGRTALHLAIIENIHSDLVQLLMTVSSISVNARDSNGMTPLDHLRRQPVSATSAILTRDLLSAGGIFSSDNTAEARKSMVYRLRAQGAVSPGTSFKIRDVEILLYTGLDVTLISKAETDHGKKLLSSLSPQVNQNEGTEDSCISSTRKSIAAKQTGNNPFKRILHWPTVKGKMVDRHKKSIDVSSITSSIKWSTSEETPVPLRHRFLKAPSSSSAPSNKRPLSVRSNLPSPAAKKKLASGMKHGVMQAVPLHFPRRSRSSSFSQTSIPSPKTTHKQKGASIDLDLSGSSYSNHLDDDVTPRLTHKQGSLKYLCFGAPSLCGKDPVNRQYVHTRSRSDISVA